MKFKFFFQAAVSLLFFFIYINVFSQYKYNAKELRSKFAKQENRIKFEKQLLDFIDTTLISPISKQNIKQWHKALNDASLYSIKNDTVNNSLKYIFENYKSINYKLIYRAIQTAYNLYPHLFKSEIENIFSHETNKNIISACTIYLQTFIPKSELKKKLSEKYPDYKDDLILTELNNYLDDSTEHLPSLIDIFSHKFQSDKTIVYSVHRKDRHHPGLVLVKKPDGQFVRNDSGKIFNVPQLALSASNFPSFLKNGNTPQGIYSIQKFYHTPTEEIGPSPILLSRIPFEIDAKKFYHNQISKNKWNIKDYKNLLPETWQNYDPIYEAYNAGKLGRRVIVAHGSADDPKFYKDKSYFPLTPTKGCLVTKESWDKKGRLLESDQVKFMNAFFSTNQLYGFLIVIEIDDKKEPVTIEELLPVLEKAESVSKN